jgi:hypothetical protein
MKTQFTKIGAATYCLWGLLHVAGGAMLLSDSLSDDPTKALASIGSALPGSEIPDVTHPAVSGVLAFHSFNILWMGLMATIVAITMNWVNSKAGFWINTAVIGLADTGLIAFMLLPGIMKPEEGLIGPVIGITGMILLMPGLGQKRAPQKI